jgi:hypothetical protein
MAEASSILEDGPVRQELQSGASAAPLQEEHAATDRPVGPPQPVPDHDLDHRVDDVLYSEVSNSKIIPLVTRLTM